MSLKILCISDFPLLQPSPASSDSQSWDYIGHWFSSLYVCLRLCANTENNFKRKKGLFFKKKNFPCLSNFRFSMVRRCSQFYKGFFFFCFSDSCNWFCIYFFAFPSPDMRSYFLKNTFPKGLNYFNIYFNIYSCDHFALAQLFWDVNLLENVRKVIRIYFSVGNVKAWEKILALKH